MNLLTLETNLNNTLRPQYFHDFCPNGLIVDALGNKMREVHKVVTGVSLRKELIEEAENRGADVIFVHHPNGFWNSDKNKCIDNSQHGNYVRMLIQKGISLFGYHLPLDAHDSLGNNATVFKLLNLEPTVDRAESHYDSIRLWKKPERFMYDNIGYGGPGTITKELLDSVFPKGYQAFNFEPGLTYDVAVCTGSAASELDAVIDRGYTMLVTGEVRESTPILAEEYGIAVIAAGHHRSEVFGVQNVADYIKRIGVDAEFVDIDNQI